MLVLLARNLSFYHFSHFQEKTNHKKKLLKTNDFQEFTLFCTFLFVRLKGLEPPRLSAPDPKSGTATNYATAAITKRVQRYKFIFYLSKDFPKFD